MSIDRVEDKDMHVSEELPVLDFAGDLGISSRRCEAVQSRQRTGTSGSGSDCSRNEN